VPARAGAALVLTLLLWTGLVLTAAPAHAHPLGDFTVNTHLGLRVEPAAVALDVVVDVAEVPTLRAFPGVSAASSEAVPEPDRRAYRERTCPALRDAVSLRRGGDPVALDVVDSTLQFLPGSAGLATARLHCSLRSAAGLQTVGHVLVLTDSLAVQPVGWREVTAVGDGVVLATSDVPADSISGVLRDYPEDMLAAPLDQRGATVGVAAGSGVVVGAATEPGGPPTTMLRGVDPLTTAFLDLVSTTRLGLVPGVVGLALAVVLGGLHALAPGHGKTLIAASLVGRDGSARQAVLIGVGVTLTHTAGVLVLGVLLSAAVVTAPEQVYRWLGLVSGLLLVVIGLSLLRRALHGHDHGHGHGHGHEPGQEHEHGPTDGAGGAAVATRVRARPDQQTDRRVAAGSDRAMLGVGFAGGLVPSPSALVVLLGGIALGRAWFGVLLVLAYGVGMALALVGAGLLLVRARGRVERWSSSADRHGPPAAALRLVRALPVLTAGVVVVLGTGLVVQALTRV